MRRRDRLLFACAAVHLAATVMSVVHAYGATMARFDDPTLPEGVVEQVAARNGQILTLPMRLVWTSWASNNLPTAVKWVVFVLNSFVWGAGVVLITKLLRITKFPSSAAAITGLVAATALLPPIAVSASKPSGGTSVEFAKYPAEPRLTGKPAQPKLNTARARRFRTVLRRAASEGANFNGRYRLVKWGCGTNCIEWAVINLVNGDVWFAESPVSSCWAPGVDQPHFRDWFEYRLDSRLFYLYECKHVSMGQTLVNRHVYVWSGARPRLLRTQRLRY